MQMILQRLLLNSVVVSKVAACREGKYGPVVAVGNLNSGVLTAFPNSRLGFNSLR